MAHVPISPAIQYWGTPVVLVSTTNPDGTANIAPMSSAFWLLDRCVLGLESVSQTTNNMRRTGQCVLNLASDDMVSSVNALARTTGTDPVPPGKVVRGYNHEKDKFGVAGLTAQTSEKVQPPRIQECPVQMEAVAMGCYEMLPDRPELKEFISVFAFEVKIVKTWMRPELRLAGHENRVDPDRWKPLIMSFQQFYGLGERKAGGSVLGKIEEELYRVPEESA